MSRGQKKAPKLGGGGSDSKEVSPAETTHTPSHNAATKSSAEVSFSSKVPDAEKEVLGYLLNFPDDTDSFNKLKREHFGHPKCRIVFNVIQEFSSEGKSPTFEEVAPVVIERDPRIKLGEDLSQWLSLGNSNTFPLYLEELERRAEDRANGGVRYYFKDVQSSTSEAKFVQNCPYPTDSLIHEFVLNVRKQVESSDSLIIGSAIGMIAALIGRNIWFELDRKKHPNIYALLTADPGDRKSSVMGLSKRMLKEVLGKDSEDHFLSDASSPEALFDEFDYSQDKIWMTDEATPILHAWAYSPQGQTIAKRLLSIYDCDGWSETYKQNKTDTNKTGRRVIESTSLTMILGCVFAAIKETKIASQDGLKRRFLNYVSDGPERVITRPKRMERDVREYLVSMFKKIPEWRGEATMSEAAWSVWDDYQHKNRARQKRAESLELKYTLSEEPAHVFKMAVIFQVARSAFGKVPWNVISPETLQLAIDHVAGCIEASQAIDAIHQTDAGQEDEDFVFDTINDPDNGFTRLLGTDAILVTKAQLTRRFSNKGNKSKITTTDMKNKIIPSLIKKGLCIALEKKGNKKGYLFRNDEVI
jgi:hypothetical protein